jgi:hypothetical protein
MVELLPGTPDLTGFEAVRYHLGFSDYRLKLAGVPKS